MAERIDNPWWTEGWRLVRERLPDIISPRRRRVLAVVVGASALVGGIGGWLLFPQIEDASDLQRWVIVIMIVVLAVQLASAASFLVWAHRDREPDYRAGRVSLGLEDVFDLRTPSPALSPELRDEAIIHVERTRRALPAAIVGHVLAQFFAPVAFVAMFVAGWWTTNSWLLLAMILLNAPQPFLFLKWLGSTTAQLRRIEAAPEPPTYIGPKGWKIQAPRNAPGEDPTPG
jgi:nitrate/nitrite transporter NarK